MNGKFQDLLVNIDSNTIISKCLISLEKNEKEILVNAPLLNLSIDKHIYQYLLSFFSYFPSYLSQNLPFLISTEKSQSLFHIIVEQIYLSLYENDQSISLIANQFDYVSRDEEFTIKISSCHSNNTYPLISFDSILNIQNTTSDYQVIFADPITVNLQQNSISFLLDYFNDPNVPCYFEINSNNDPLKMLIQSPSINISLILDDSLFGNAQLGNISIKIENNNTIVNSSHSNFGQYFYEFIEVSYTSTLLRVKLSQITSMIDVIYILKIFPFFF